MNSLRRISLGSAVWIGLLLFLGLGALAGCQNPDERQRQERCENNKYRLAELERQVDFLQEQTIGVWSEEKQMRVRDTLQVLFEMKSNQAALRGPINLPDTDYEKLDRAMKATWSLCIADMQKTTGQGDAAAIRARNNKVCLQALYAGLSRTLDDAVKMLGQLPEIESRITDLQHQMQNHRTNLLALGCTAAGLDIDLSGNWNTTLGKDEGWLTLRQQGKSFTGILQWSIHMGAASVQRGSINGDYVEFVAKYADGEEATYKGIVEVSGENMTGDMTSTSGMTGHWTAKRRK
jgi:hypothetical protein